MALFGKKLTEEELVQRGAERFRNKIGKDSTAEIFSDYLNILEQIQDADDESQVGFLIMRNYRTFKALYREVFEEDLAQVKVLKNDDVGELFQFFQKVATSPLPSAPSVLGDGASPSPAEPTA